jgi:hypothetical protein
MRVLRVLLITVATLVVLAGIAAYAASRMVVAHIQDILGEQGHAQSIHVGFGHVVLENVEIGAPNGWPAKQTLTAARISMVPNWRALLQNETAIQDMTVEDYYLSVLRPAGGGLQVLPTLEERARRLAEEDAAKGDGTRRKHTTYVRHVSLVNGRVDYFDASASKPPARIPFEHVEGEAGPIHAPATDDHTELRLRGEMVGKARRGSVNVQGWIALASHDVDLTTTVRGADATLLRPYLQKHATPPISQGTLDLDMRSRVQSRKLNAQGTATLTNLGFDDAGSTILSLPRKAVLAALQDNKGRVTFNFTVTGNLDDPKFSLDDSLSQRFVGGFGKALGVSVEGVANGVGGAVKGLGGALDQLFNGK